MAKNELPIPSEDNFDKIAGRGPTEFNNNAMPYDPGSDIISQSMPSANLLDLSSITLAGIKIIKPPQLSDRGFIPRNIPTELASPDEIVRELRSWRAGMSNSIEPQEAQIADSSTLFCDQFGEPRHRLYHGLLVGFLQVASTTSPRELEILRAMSLNSHSDQWGLDFETYERRKGQLENFIYLIALDTALKNSVAEDSHDFAQAREFLFDHLAIEIGSVRDFHLMSGLVGSDTEDGIKSALELLATYNPHLKNSIGEVLNRWTELADKSRIIKSESMDIMCNLLESDEQSFEPRSSDKILLDMDSHSKEEDMIRELANRLEPPPQDSAWYRPIHHVGEIAQLKKGIHLEIDGTRNIINTRNGRDLVVALMSDLSKIGYNYWIITEKVINSSALMNWLVENNDFRSASELASNIADYFTLSRGNKVPTLRNFLFLPQTGEPPGVTKWLSFLEAIWSTKELFKVKCLIVCGDVTDAIMEATSANKLLVLSDRIEFSTALARVPSSARFKLRALRPDSGSMVSNYSNYLDSAVEMLGRKCGFGELEAVALPIKKVAKALIEVGCWQLGVEAPAHLYKLPYQGLELIDPVFGQSENAIIYCSSVEGDESSQDSNPVEIISNSPDKVLV